MKNLVCNLQVSGLDRTGKTTFLRDTLGFGNRVIHFGAPMFPMSPVATYHALIQVMEEISAWPGKRDCLNSFTVFDRGLLELYAYDAIRRTRTLTVSLFQEFHAQFREIIRPSRAVYLVGLTPIEDSEAEDELDVVLGQFRDVLRERFVTAGKYLRLWGDEVHFFEDFRDPQAAEIVRNLFLEHKTVGIGNTIVDGKIQLGTAT